MDRCVQPILNFRNSRWPWTASLADAQSNLQRRMLSPFLSTERWPCETLEGYCRRRLRAVSNLAHRQGDWGTQHAIRLCHWADHLERSRNQRSIAAIMYDWHDAAWLEQRRLDPHIGGSLHPGTRCSSGFLHARWDESVSKARARVLQA